MRNRYFITYGLLIVGLLSLWGCGKDESFTAPSGSAITISPSSLSFDDKCTSVTDEDSGETTVVCPSETTRFQVFTILVLDADSEPMNDTEITISFSFAVPAGSYAQFYDDSTPKDSPMTVKTDENGVYNLRFDYHTGAGLEYSDNLEVRSGTVYNSIPISVSASVE